MIQSICKTCHETFEGNRMYCGSRCKDRAKMRPCTVCGEPAWVTKGATVTTHSKCKSIPDHGTRSRYMRGCRCAPCQKATADVHRAYSARRRADVPTHLHCQSEGCTVARKAHGLCGKHLRRKQKAEGTWSPSPSDAWDAPARMARSTRRKAMTRGDLPSGENFTVTDLMERDGKDCGICGDTIKDVAYPDPHSPSIDHIKPLSLGGDHTKANARAAHLRCNIVRGNRD